MGKKRKRPIKDNPLRAKPSPYQPTSTPSSANDPQAPNAAETSHPVISPYYCQVVTLRQYILQRIPRSSKSRRRRIASVRGGTGRDDLVDLLDTTLVGISEESSLAHTQERQREFLAFTQAQQETQIGTDTGPACPQSDLVDYVIWSAVCRPGKQEHVLRHGFRAANGKFACTIPNVETLYPNKNVQVLKQAPWSDVLALLGKNGDEIMLRLLLDCGLFAAVDAKKGIYCQISGLSLSSLKPIQTSPESAPTPRNDSASGKKDMPCSDIKTSKARENNNRLSLNAIVFCRPRMLYARPHLDSKGRIKFGLPNHVLSRYPSSGSLQHTLHVMKYIFPRQFGLHNVFTSPSSYRDNPLSKNYSSREAEIAAKGFETRNKRRVFSNDTTVGQPEIVKVPKRLRGKALELVRRLQNRNKRCHHKELLWYYCSEELSDPWTLGPLSVESGDSAIGLASSRSLITQPSLAHRDVQNKSTDNGSISKTRKTNKKSGTSKPKIDLTDYATPTASISAFCRAVIRNLIPPEFYGVGEQGIAHQKIILGHVDRFIRMRRFESLSLHEVCEGIKITQIPWLGPQSLTGNRISASDLQKRRELFHEFLYYLFDSILLPLIRGNFYVTESQVHKQRLFYFRHDIWRRLTAQPLANLRSFMFEELSPVVADAVLADRKSLGYGSLRLLPKTTGIRPIMNLKRRTMLKTTYAGQKRLNWAQSVNSAINPVYSMLNYERSRRTGLLGASMFSVGDMHSRLREFKKSLVGKGWNRKQPLYFVKLDIQSCFDTIPQGKLVRLVEKLASEEDYRWMKYVEIRPNNEFGDLWPQRKPEQRRTWPKYLQRVGPTTKPEHISDAIANGSVPGRRNTVFIDTIAQREYSGERLLDILNEHVRNNLVKIGKKYFRQRNGIPQGSVMSSMLCSLFYAEMERNVLDFLQTKDALLLRLLDDFLLITLDSNLAMDFLRVMVRGQPEYGISVNPAKSLVNFAASVDGAQIPRVLDTSLFPYCGSLIDTRTLEISKDQDRLLEGAESASAALHDSLSVDSARTPGRSFHKKVLGSVKQSLHPMYLDTTHNTLPSVLLNLYKALVTTAMKMHRYTKSLPVRKQPRPEIVVRTISDATELAYRLIRGRTGLCKVTYHQTQYLSAAAFRFVLGRKQTRYAGVLGWLNKTLAAAREDSSQRDGMNNPDALLGEVVRKGDRTYRDWRF